MGHDDDTPASSAAREIVPKRFLASVAVLSLLVCAFLIKRSTFPEVQNHPVLDDTKTPTLKKETAEGDWKPPEEWDPTKLVYDSFESTATKYGSHINDLSSQTSSTSRVKLTYHPYPDYNSLEYQNKHPGAFVSCHGPRGKRLNQSYNDAVTAFTGRPRNFPQAPLGSSQTIGMDQEVCFERHGRFGAYGLGPDSSGIAAGQSPPPSINWDNVDWGRLQSECVKENQDRFDMNPRPRPGDVGYNNTVLPAGLTSSKAKRSAVLFRSYDGMKYNPDLLRTMRAVITELSLSSGGEFEAFLLVQIKDTSLPIFENEEIYQNVKRQRVPKEFWNITVLWSEALWPKLYPLVPEASRGVHFSQWLPVQWFLQKYPQFDHYWNWEMDVRYTGHHCELLRALDQWSRKQPRRGMWERNSRFYIPAYHGDYANFTSTVQKRYQSDSPWNRDDTTIWGPHPPFNQKPLPFDSHPPAKSSKPQADDFEWGVGEDADLITLLPMFNPDPTRYVWHSEHWNYPLFLNPAGPPRRTTIITFYRLSHRLLSMMHYENTRTPGHHMSSETWPQSTALHHGFKAVFAPHPIFMELDWPAEATNFIFNNGDAPRIVEGFSGQDSHGEGSGGWESVFGLGREHNFDPSTWYYRAQFASKIYKRYLGHEIDGIGGALWEREHGTYCLPPMLLHPIKEVQDPEVVPMQDEIEEKEETDDRLQAIADSEKVEKAGQDAPGK